MKKNTTLQNKTTILKTLLACLLLVPAIAGFGESIKFASVLANVENKEHLTDGNFETASKFKSGESTVTLQLGNVKTLRELKIQFGSIPVKGSVEVFISDNFIQWKSVKSQENIRANYANLNLNKISGSFLKIVFKSRVDFSISEIECISAKTPKNEIYDVKIKHVDDSSATIAWKTKEKSQEYFFYAKKVNGKQQSIVEVNFKTEHEIKIGNLLKGTEYVYMIVSESPDKSRIESKQMTFKTTGIPLPDFWVLKAKAIKPFGIELYYKANVPTSYDLMLGTSPDKLSKILGNSKLETDRDISVSGLQPETKYYYRLYLKDKYNKVVKTPAIDFVTPAYNIALGKPVSGTFTYIEPDIKSRGFGDTGIKNLVDGDLNFFGGMAVSLLVDNADQYAIIDLGKKEPIKAINVFWWGIAYSRNYRIDISDDGSKWKTVRQNLDAEKATPMRSPKGDLLMFHKIIMDYSSRYVRIMIPAKSKRGTQMKQFSPRKRLYLGEITIIKNMK